MIRRINIPDDISLKCFCGSTKDWELKEYMDSPSDCEPTGTGFYYYKCKCNTKIDVKLYLKLRET